MKVLKIHNGKLEWKKGDFGYKQGIRGQENYRHMKDSVYYNGYGGARAKIKMELKIMGKDERGVPASVDVRHYLVEAIGKKQMRDSLYEILSQCIPDLVEVDTDTGRLTEKSLEEIKSNYQRYVDSKS